MTADITALPLGRTEIDGDRVVLQVMEARTRELRDDSYELHRDYMDIQIDIEGCEVIETCLLYTSSGDGCGGGNRVLFQRYLQVGANGQKVEEIGRAHV